MPLYLLRATLSHLSFRIPSIYAVAKTFDFPLRIVSTNYERGGLVVELESEEHVLRILERSMLVLWACELYAEAENYDDLHLRLQNELGRLRPYEVQTYKIHVEAANLHLSGDRVGEITRSFPYIGQMGKVDLSNPQTEYYVFEDYDWKACNQKEKQRTREGNFAKVYFGRLIGHTKARKYLTTHAVASREYYGNTSMDAEMGFIMAEQTLPMSGKVIYDPFAGTGSLLYACAAYGAMVLGSDIDGRQMRGKKRGKGVIPGIMRAADQYGVGDKILDCMTFDITKNPLRRGGWLDAIITDPPYGVRAGAKRLGKRESKGRPMRDNAYILEDGSFAHLQPGYLPPSRPYELSHLTLDLIRLARYHLIKGGRLVFFLPTVTEEYDAIDIPVVEGMKELKWGEGSVQDFGKWGRRLITMEKTAEDDGPIPTFDDYTALEGHTAAHQGFNQRYFEGFKPRHDTPTQDTQ